MRRTLVDPHGGKSHVAVLDLVLFPDDILRVKCAPVDDFGDELQQLVDDMVETMYDAPGVGLAAPQVGETLRLTGGNREQTASLLGIGERTLYRKLKEYGLK